MGTRRIVSMRIAFYDCPPDAGTSGFPVFCTRAGDSPYDCGGLCQYKALPGPLFGGGPRPRFVDVLLLSLCVFIRHRCRPGRLLYRRIVHALVRALGAQPLVDGVQDPFLVRAPQGREQVGFRPSPVIRCTTMRGERRRRQAIRCPIYSSIVSAVYGMRASCAPRSTCSKWNFTPSTRRRFR